MDFWRFQKTAYDVQTEIDGFYNDFNNLDTPESKIGVLRVLTKIRSEFAGFTQVISNLSNPDRLAATDPDVLLLLDAFPQLKNIGNYVNDTLSYFDRFTDYRQLQNEDVQKIVDTIKKIRQYCIAIQALNNPSAIVSQYGADLLKDEISQLLKDIDVQDVVPTLKKINETLKKIIAICNNINNIIQFATTIIRLFSTLIFVFRVIIRFLKTLPAPNQFTTVGVTNTASDVLNEIKKKGPTTFEVRLAQISSLLGSITLLLNTLLPIINEVIQKVNNLLANLQNCDNAPEDLKNSMQDTVDNLQSSVNTLQAFLDNKTQNDLTRSDTQLGEYTIQIITEQVTDETFNLRRRYGVALNNSGIVQVTSQPTFASDDNVIINEVKLLLQQAGLIQEGSGIYTDSELNTLNQANSYLFNDNINTQPDLSQINAFDSDQSSITNYIRKAGPEWGPPSISGGIGASMIATTTVDNLGLSSGDQIYIYVGGAGAMSGPGGPNGGHPGGGGGGSGGYGGGGGGMSSVYMKGSFSTGTLLLIAGAGAGGAGAFLDISHLDSRFSSRGGTQSSGGAGGPGVSGGGPGSPGSQFNGGSAGTHGGGGGAMATDNNTMLDFNNLCIMDSVDDPSWNPKL